jgi:hypothetical protein
MTRNRKRLSAALVIAAFAALSTLGWSGLSAAVAAYGYGYGYEYGDANLIVVKHVVNDNGGTATASQFTMTINGVTASGGNSFPGSEAGTNKTVTPGSYSVTENGPSGYTATFSAGCSGTLAGGETRTCTVTNDDKPAHLVVIKHVINDDKGSSVASDFTMKLNGVTAQGGNTFPGEESPGTDKIVAPGSYSVSETGPAKYVTTFSADCSGSISIGQTKTCTVTNNDLAPSRTIGFWRNHEDDTTAVLPQQLGGYTVASFAQASAVFDASNCGSSTANAAIGCLAGQLLAAELNLARGALPCIQPTVAKSNTFLSGGTVTAGGVTAAGIVYTGPSGTYTLSAGQRTVALKLKDALDAYNNGKTCANP